MNIWRIIQQDIVGGMILITGTVCGGLLLNQFRDPQLPLIYQSKASRLQQDIVKVASVDRQAPPLDAPDAVSQTPEGNPRLPSELSLKEFQVIIQKKEVAILDARPEIFHRLGHVPRAISLPRENFAVAYAHLKPPMSKDQPIVVYCSESACEDSVMVKDALHKLGFTNVAVFRGGWGEWSSANLPTEKSE